MAFLIRPPGQVKKAKAKLKPKSKNAQEILNRLQGFLNQNTSEPVEILCSFWEDQRNAITYKELREVVQSGMLTQKQFEDWQQDYSVLVEKKMAGVWMSAMAAGVAGQPMFDSLSFSINTQDPGIVSWIKDRGAEFVTSCTAEQKKAIQSLLVKKITDQHTVDELARFIRPCIGLTDGDTKAALKLYDTVKATLQTNHPRMKPENIRKKALDATQKYAEQKHRQRAFTIAQTELEFAYNRGADQGVRQAQSQGLIGKTIKRWITSGDDSVCSICAALDGTEIEMDDNFDFKGRLLFAGQKMLPPAHPRCACAVEYIEIEPPVFQPENMTEIETEVDAEEQKEFSSGEEAEGYFGKRPDRSLRRSDREEYDRQLDYFKTQSPYGKWSQQTTSQEEASIEGIVSITNPVKATGGTEEETDDELRERIMEANEQMDDSYIGNESDYKRWAESVAGIGTAIVVPEWNGPETVKIIVLDGNGEAANETLQKAVYNYIMSPESPLDRLAPPNTILTVSAPELVEIDYTIKSIELEDGYSQEEVLKDFKAGLAKYYKTVNSEGEVKYNWVHSVLTNTPGVDDFEELLMNGGISNIKIKLDQYPSTKSVMVKEGS